MPSAPSFPDLTPGQGFDPQREMMALTEQTVRVVTVAHALIASHRRVDVAGLQQQIGLLCAKALDLPPGQTALARIELQRLASGLGALQAVMRENSA